ncbi:rRNA pseudouridine synthase [Collinsella sp. zg1085]|nr:rRNA pseudouridine synthase [Collinsella sp. zg1085]
MRLQRFLARAGVASRRGSETLITAGRVSVNGIIVTELGTKVDAERDAVCVDSIAVALADKPAYIMLHKPSGVLTTMHDPQGRVCVASLLPVDEFPGLFPVGRLDADTTGLLLAMTDGQLAQKLLHPSGHVWKCYEALVDGHVMEHELEPLRQGIMLDDGPCLPAQVELVGYKASSCTQVRIHIREGRKNQVKRMFSAIHHPVLTLHRPSFGPLELGSLAQGAWRLLSDSELVDLHNALKGQS